MPFYGTLRFYLVNQFWKLKSGRQDVSPVLVKLYNGTDLLVNGTDELVS